jgi:hypothetical protein
MNRWYPMQNVTPWIIGGLLLITPFALGAAAFTTPLLSAWILAAVVSVVSVSLALLWTSRPPHRLLVGMTVLVGLVLVLAPWALGESLLAIRSLTACILGGGLILAAGWSTMTPHVDWDRLLNDRSVRGSERGTQAFSSSRRVSHPASMR